MLGHADRLPDLLEAARRRLLTEDEAHTLAEALGSHQPWLEWAGKREKRWFDVDPVALHIHERISAQAVIKLAQRQPIQRMLFVDPKLEYREAVQFYQHDVDWVYRDSGEAYRAPGRRPASYWFKTQRVATQQLGMVAEEQREELPLVNALRHDVERWRNLNHEGATEIIKQLLRHWRRDDRLRRLFFCQLEAAETIILLNEILLSGKRTRFKPAFEDQYLEKLRDIPADPTLPPLTRLGIKMATGSGKTVVMAMLIAWAFCNRGKLPSDERRRRRKTKETVYGRGDIFPECFSNTEAFKPTVRIDSKLLAEAETGDPTVSKSEAAEQLRQIVSTVGVPGAPGEQVRCVVSVAMLNEGWDAHNVTNILGLRAFDSQLLCEQVVGRGLRRMDYTPDPKTGLLTEEYVDIYGVPFSLIPFKGRPTHRPEIIDKPKNHVRALPERADYEIRFPVVEGYAFALRQNVIIADIDQIEPLRIEPEYEPTAVFVKPRVGYQIGVLTMEGPGEFEEQNREAFYASTHPQTIEFEIARQIVGLLGSQGAPDELRLPLQSRHQLFPQVLRIVHAYISRRVDLRGMHPCELGLQRYVQRIIDFLLAAIRPDEARGEPPLMPILNRYVPNGSTESVDFKTTKPCFSTTYSHISLVASDTATWEQSAAFRLEQAVLAGTVKFYARNDQLGFTIPYDYMGVSHAYEPDYLVRLCTGDTLILEIKGMETEQDKAKHQGARRWVDAVNNWGSEGQWQFHVNRGPQMLGRELRYLVGPGGN